MMTHVNVFEIAEVGKDFAVFGNIRYNFDDDETGTKEDAAAFFQGLKGKKVAIEAPESAGDGTGHHYVAVDFWDLNGDNVKVIPFPFSVSSVEISL
jgi:hypothetical protein